MGSEDKGGDVEKRFSNLNLNLKRSFSKVKNDIQKLAKTNEEHIDELNTKLTDFGVEYVEKQEFNSELDSFSKKYNSLRREINKREKLKKELKEALKLREAVNSVAEDIKKINGIKREFERFRDSVVSKEEFNMQANKFDARIKKRAQDITNTKKDLDELKKKFIDESYFNKQLSDLRQEIQLVRKNSVENNYFRKSLNRLDSRFKGIINFLKKHPEIKKEYKKKIDEIEKSQGKEESALKSAWNGIVDFFTEEVGESEEEKPKKIKKKGLEKKKKLKKEGVLKRTWNAVVDFFTEEEFEEEWLEKREKPKKKERKPKKTLKKTDKKNKFIKYVFVLVGVSIIFLLYYSNFWTKIIGFIISYKYNILLGIIILAIIIFLSERREKK